MKKVKIRVKCSYEVELEKEIGDDVAADLESIVEEEFGTISHVDRLYFSKGYDWLNNEVKEEKGDIVEYEIMDLNVEQVEE